MRDVWSQWFEDNYKYFVMGIQTTTEDKYKVLKLANICEKHKVSLKTYLDILTEFSKEDTND